MAEIPFRYDQFRPARMMRSGYNPGTPTNRATHMLLNNSTGGHVLLVWNCLAFTSASQVIIAGAQQLIMGSVSGSVAPFMTGGQIGPGLHYYQDTAAAITNIDLILGGAPLATSYMVDKPIMALQPGWGMAVQVAISATRLALSFIWEFIDPADLYFSELFDAP